MLHTVNEKKAFFVWFPQYFIDTLVNTKTSNYGNC